jgi:hypothetical protein
MKENVEKFNDVIKNTITYLAEQAEKMEGQISEKGTFQEIKVSIKQFFPDYGGNVLFAFGFLPGEDDRYFNIEVSTQTGISDSDQFYRGNPDEVLNFLRNPSSLGIIIEKVRNMGMYLLIEEDRRSDYNDDWK